MLNVLPLIASIWCNSNTPAILTPQIVENRTVQLTQTLTLHDIPKDAGHVRIWAPIPSDTAWQRVLDRKVVSATAGARWRIVPQSEGRGDFLYAEIDQPQNSELSVSVECIVERQGVHFAIDPGARSAPIQPEQFDEALAKNAPLMEVDSQIQTIANSVCGDEQDPLKQATMLMHAVADMADHYSKDPTKPTCGRGAASDCLAHGGGCCTDMHSLFIALARARGIPARIQYGYRLLDSKAGNEFDPGYRCWVEFFAPGAGWVPTDIVAADNADESDLRWISLSATRVWLWQGRSFELTPKAQAGKIDTMLCGWAEIDGKPVDVLPAADGSPSKLRRTVKFDVIKTDRAADAPKLPE